MAAKGKDQDIELSVREFIDSYRNKIDKGEMVAALRTQAELLNRDEGWIVPRENLDYDPDDLDDPRANPLNVRPAPAGATRADEAGVKTCVVSTDRDAFQLCTENVCLMMTPRGVADVHVYTPERVEARYGVRPDQVPDFIGLKGDTSDNIPGVPGIGDKTAGQLIAQYGSLEEVLEHVDELSPARRKNLTEHADQARVSKRLATMPPATTARRICRSGTLALADYW